MSDHIRLSLWFGTQTAAQVLPRLAQAVEVLPAEARERGVRQLAVTALDWSQPPLLEERFDAGIALELALELMRAWAHEDCACELELAWLLWRYGASGWEQVPHPVRCVSLGPLFGEGLAAEEGHLQIDFGLDEAFLAELAPWEGATRAHLQANILQLLAFSHKLQTQLQPRRRRLWSEGEEDWTRKLVLRLQDAEGTDAKGMRVED